MELAHKLLGLICVFAVLSLVMLNTIYPQLVVPQLVSFIIGLVVFGAVQNIQFGFWKWIAPYAFTAVVVLLIVTYVLGKTAKGSTRWIPLGFSQVQPSQFMKPILALSLAVFAFQKRKKSLNKHILQMTALAAIPLTLVFFQPDLGTTIVLGAICIAIFVYWGMPPRYFALFGLGLVVLATMAWVFIFKPYQKERIFTLINPSNNLSTSGYNALQSQIAVGSGKLLGRGLGRGVQSELRFLPERQTDFFFASFSEQLGFIGNLILFGLYAVLFLILLSVIEMIHDKEGKLYSIGVLCTICVQFAINIGMNIGILPITGITLPFLSYGGSSIVALCLSLGLMMSALRSSSRQSQVEIQTFL